MLLKRFFLFFAVNILIVITLSLVLNLLGVQPYLTRYGINYESLAIFCLVWGMGGSIISLLLSKVMAKWMMGVQIVEGSGGQYSDLIQMVHFYSRRAGLEKMPEVGVYESDELNAFATGPSRSNSLVAVSTGLLHRMRRDEVEGVIAHEVSHIANGDMVTMTIVQGIINAFVMFLARAAAYAVEQFLRKDDEEGQSPSFFVRYLLVTVFEIVFGLLGMIVVAYVSRQREFRADAGSAKIAGKDKMIASLKALQGHYEELSQDASSVSTLKISNKGNWFAIFSTHPPLEVRIEALMRGDYR